MFSINLNLKYINLYDKSEISLNGRKLICTSHVHVSKHTYSKDSESYVSDACFGLKKTSITWTWVAVLSTPLDMGNSSLSYGIENDIYKVKNLIY